MYLTWLADARLYEMLARIDADLAETARTAGCRALRRVLHSALVPAQAPRRPRRDAGGLRPPPQLLLRRRGLPKRRTPPSVRFLGRKVYLGAVVVLATALRHGPTPHARGPACASSSGSTPGRSRGGGSGGARPSPRAAWWQAMRGRFAPPVPTRCAAGLAVASALPATARTPLVALLRFVAPTTTASDGAGLFEGRRRPAEDAR